MIREYSSSEKIGHPGHRLAWSRLKRVLRVGWLAFALCCWVGLGSLWGCGTCYERLVLSFEEPASGEPADLEVQIKSTIGDKTRSCTFTMQVVGTSIPYSLWRQGCDLQYTIHSGFKFDMEFMPPHIPDKMELVLLRGGVIILSETLTPAYETREGSDGKQCRYVAMSLKR